MSYMSRFDRAIRSLVSGLKAIRLPMPVFLVLNTPLSKAMKSKLAWLWMTWSMKE